jgi:exodeoxyribonuclease V alpha subunit
MTSVFSLLSHLKEKNFIQQEDIEFAHFWINLDPELSQYELLIFLCSLFNQGNGHIAIDQHMLDDYLIKMDSNESINLVKTLEDSLLVGKPGDFKPFIVFKNLLYQHKSYVQEHDLAIWLTNKSVSQINVKDEFVQQIHTNYEMNEDDLQSTAVFKSFFQSLLFITGGPGTGKTFTVKRIIEAHQSIFGDSYTIKIAAPTGKAAQRINDSLEHDENVGLKAVTIHQLLGSTDLLNGFTYHSGHLLSADLIIIDEASMMDLGLWNALTDAVSINTRLIIVGDPFQLASVESGSVLSDICSITTTSSIPKSISDLIIKLERRYRFSQESGIHRFADAINRSDVTSVLKILNDPNIKDVNWIEPSTGTIGDIIKQYAIEPVLNNEQAMVNTHQLLSALRSGPFGCNYLNKIIEIEIKKRLHISQSNVWFRSRIIMATKNDYQLGIQNGEVGFYDEVNNHVKFSNQKTISTEQLTHYESGYCITIHKSQGSEYDHIAIILPDKQNQILSKELLYTAVTRAKKSVLIVGKKDILKQCISKKLIRKSGLISQLAGP